jgi:hypothetical protein
MKDFLQSDSWIATLIFLLFSIIVVSVSSCEINSANKKAELIKAGGDPIKVRCAFTSNSDSICLVAAGAKH